MRGNAARPAPDFAALRPGYGSYVDETFVDLPTTTTQVEPNKRWV